MRRLGRIFDGPVDPYLGPEDGPDPRDPDNQAPPPPTWQPWYTREEE